MDVDAVPPVLRMRLGHDATLGLLELLDQSHKEAREPMMLAEFESRIRQDMSELRADFRQDMSELRADLRQEMAQLGAGLRQEMAQLGADLRREMGQMGVGLSQEIATGRVELFKWCFLFWIGQVLAIGGMMGVMLRVMR